MKVGVTLGIICLCGLRDYFNLVSSRLPKPGREDSEFSSATDLKFTSKTLWDKQHSTKKVIKAVFNAHDTALASLLVYPVLNGWNVRVNAQINFLKLCLFVE